MSGLATIAQDDFAVGILRGTARDTQAGVGAYEILNGLISDDGDIYRRGGGKRFTTAAVGPINWIWSGNLATYAGYFVAGADGYVNKPYLLLGTPTGYYSVPPDGGSPTLIPTTSGHTLIGATHPMQAAVAFDGPMSTDMVFLPNGMMFDPRPSAGGMGNWGGNIGTQAPPDGWPPPPGSRHIAAVAGRLIWATGSTIYFSAAGAPRDFTEATNFHQLSGGARIIGCAAFRDTLLAFTDYGLWAVTNMAYDLTDVAGNVQQSLSLLVPELGLLHEAGLAPWRGKMVAACRDRVYTLDDLSAPQPISDSINELYASYVDAGAKPGLAKVFRNTLFLPMLAADGSMLDLLTCRLDRPVRARHLYHPWSRFDGHARKQKVFDVQATQVAPRLLSGGTDGYVCDLTGVFTPDATNTADADGTTPPFVLETREFPLGQGLTHLKRIRLRYTSQGTGQVQISYSADPLRAVWTNLPNQPLTSNGAAPLAWWLPRVARVRYARVRLHVDEPLTRLVVHRVELEVRQATHDR